VTRPLAAVSLRGRRGRPFHVATREARHPSMSDAPSPLKRGVVTALVLGAVLARIAAVWSSRD